MAEAAGRCILVVEDEYMLADDLRRDLEAAGERVLGPVASVPQALEVLERAERVDAAVLDVNLGGGMVFPVAEALRRRGVPFVLATGYEGWALPPDLAEVPRCDKPLDARQVLCALGLRDGSRRPEADLPQGRRGGASGAGGEAA